MMAQTTADLRLLAQGLAEEALSIAKAGDDDRAVHAVYSAVILFGAADVLDRRRAGMSSFSTELLA